MNDWPPVWLLFATHKRTATCLETIKSLHTHLKYPNLHYHICDDGSRETDDGTNRWHVGVLADAIGGDVTWHEMDTQPRQFNTGGNINRGIVSARENGADIHMLVFDDWALFRDLDIRPMVDVLEAYQDVGFIRLSYIVPGLSGVCVRYDSRRLNAPHLWLRLIREWSMHNPWKTEAFLVSTQPYIAHRRFFDAYEYHPVGINPGQSEVGVVTKYNYSHLGENGPQVLFPLGECITHAPWKHLTGRANDYLAVT